jgi:hypothetical protein
MVKLALVATLMFSAVVFLDRNWRVLPPSIHEYMPQHHAGLVVTDIAIVQCSVLVPLASSCRLDPAEWQRIDKDLHLGRSWLSHAYLHVRRKREEELVEGDAVVVDVAVGRLGPAAARGPAEGGSDDDGDGPWEARPMGLWLRRSTRRHASDSKTTATAIHNRII